MLGAKTLALLAVISRHKTKRKNYKHGAPRTAHSWLHCYLPAWLRCEAPKKFYSGGGDNSGVDCVGCLIPVPVGYLESARGDPSRALGSKPSHL